MKKSIKIVALLAVIVMMLAVLAGCGNKLVATKTTEDPDAGKIEEKIEITFKNDKAQKVKMTYTFEKEETAEELAAMYELFGSGSGINVESKGKKVIITMDADDFDGSDESAMTKEEVKAYYEEQGYKVK